MEFSEESWRPIERYEVEGEGRVIRVIMHKARQQTEECISIVQEHMRIADLIENTIPTLTSIAQQIAKQEGTKFLQNLRNHFIEEEQVMFPIALRADSLP